MPCTDINTLFYVASPSDLAALTSMLFATTVVDSNSGALWSNLVDSGLVTEGATSFVRRGFVPFNTFDDPTVFASLAPRAVAEG